MKADRNHRSQSPRPDPRAIGALVALVGQERLDEAERETRALIERHGEVGVLWKILGVVLLRQGRDAVAVLAKAAAMLPDDAEAHGNLGAALHDLGRWREAAPSLRTALQLNPRLPEAHRHLGNACLGLGDFEAAIAAYRGALGVDAGDGDAANRLGNALRDTGRLREAAAAYAHAIGVAPDRPEIHANLGHVLVELRHIEAAAASYGRALALKPDYVEAHVSLGTVLRLQGRAEEAEASCRAALAIAPDDVDALSLHGELLADRGEFAAAEAAFARALALNPAFAFGYFSIAAHRKMTAADTAWLGGALRLLTQPLPLRHQISLRYALGKYHDDVGQYAEAFAHFQRANELSKRYGRAYDRSAMSRRVDATIATFTRAGIASLQSHASDSERPLFVVGMPRSGTSLVEQILASHEAVHGAGELTFWQAAAASLKAAERTADGQPADGRSAAERLADIARDYLDRVTALGGGAARVVDKMPANFLHLGLIHAAFPRARIIHLRRDPRDTCLSIYFQHFAAIHPYATDLADLAHYYGEYARLMAHWRRVLPPETLLEVSYEQLIADPESWSRRLVAFVGLPWDPRCLEFHATRRVVITMSKWQVRQKIHSTSAGRWRHYEPFLGPLRDLMTLPGVT
jgi:tetratricopeptide (TPR) repeat protein